MSGISPLAAYLAMCSGGVCFSHANSSGFWLTCSLSGLDFKQGLRSVGASTAIAGLSCCAFTMWQLKCRNPALVQLPPGSEIRAEMYFSENHGATSESCISQPLHPAV